MSTANVAYACEARVAVVTLDRPQRRNAVDAATATELFAAFERFANDDAADVAILHGAGGTFCAGYDLRAAAESDGLDVPPGERAPMGPTRMILPKPVIAAIEGYAVAGGLELALWCDLRVAASDATFGVFSRRFGVPLVDLGTIRLPRIVGHGVAMDLILTGRPVEAAEAQAIGLVNRLAAPGAALAAARELAAAIVRFPQAALRHDRLSALEQWSLDAVEAVENERRHGLAVLASGETLDGMRRFASGAGRHGTFDRSN
jgi:enoyl-CoA hydratase